MDENIRARLKPGVRVKVTQQIAARDYAWTSEVRGTVTDFRQKQTGSWFAHSKNDKLWLDRLTIRKDDGEITTLNLDDYSHVEIEGGEPDEGAAKQNETDLPV
jgi:hypothetical protein